MGAFLEKLPGAMVLMPQQLKAIDDQECRKRLAAEGHSAEGLSDHEVKLALEAALGKRYCALFLPAMAVAVAVCAGAAAVLPLDGAAIFALAAVPAPMILTVGAARRNGNAKKDT
mmetsp:Transcript_39475/g.63823  ORF Transcript_39475/g.63823 Transcript_39475/m.63823 type:complete len:115 (+) Transcript_39475:51-395(+)|eukprot:CAMPEP_0115108702 /NCGR_PEP_ID=MMETSP0227-20121206/38173_1 /TAXON_ID=89957 /ORGANISM="Polarella glacialis, Strain CCMP 1383" /LENGTH=114 /DNA_ID=CAMNT_0002507071 /DNA_START=43 /DNA_END=387 /DNA_ORIENTATION=+